MSFSDDLVNDQPLPFSPSWFPPSPEPFPMMEFPQNPTLEGTEGVDEESGGSVAIPPVNEVDPSTTQKDPSDIQVQENSDGLQESEQQELLNSSLQEPTVSFMQQPEYQQQQQDYSNPGMLSGFEDPEVSLMEQLLANSDEYPESSAQQDSGNPNILNTVEKIDAFLMQDDNSEENEQQDPNPYNYFQEGDDPLMIDVGQLMGGEYNGFAQPPLIGSSELTNHLQDQLRPVVPLSQSGTSYPTYQHGLPDSHLNMYNQQPPPVIVANSEDGPLAPRRVTSVVRTNPQQNQVSTTTPPLLIPSSSTSHPGNVQELVNQPAPTLRFREIRPRPTPFFPPPFIIPPQQTVALVRRQRRRHNQVERGASSSAQPSSAQQPRLIVPRVNVDPNAAGLPQERLQNYLYSPNYESLGIPIDPHLRNLVPRRRRR